MKTSFIVATYKSQASLARMSVYINGLKQGRYANEQYHELAVNPGDIISFRFQYFKAEISVAETDKNLIVYWDVPANPIVAQLKIMFRNNLKVISVDDNVFDNPSSVYGTNATQLVASDKGLAGLGLLLAICVVFLSVTSHSQPEWWPDVAMLLGLAGAFRFTTFLFAQKVYQHSAFFAFALFSAICVFLGATSVLVFPIKLALLFIPLVLVFRAYMVFYKQQVGVAV